MSTTIVGAGALGTTHGCGMLAGAMEVLAGDGTTLGDLTVGGGTLAGAGILAGAGMLAGAGTLAGAGMPDGAGLEPASDGVATTVVTGTNPIIIEVIMVEDIPT